MVFSINKIFPWGQSELFIVVFVNCIMIIIPNFTESQRLISQIAWISEALLYICPIFSMMTFDSGIICFTKNSNDSLDSKVHYNSADLIKATTIKP